MRHRFYYLFTLLIIFSVKANALRIDSIPRTRAFSRIRLTNGDFIRGYIVQASDSTITIVRKTDWQKGFFMRTEMIPAERISGVTKNFKNGMTAGKGLLTGGLSGLTIGICIVLFTKLNDTDEDSDFNDRAFSASSMRTYLYFTGGLGVIGMFIGLFSKKKDRMHYRIDGKRENIKYNKIGLTF